MRSVAAQVGRIDVTLDGMAPQAIELTNVDSLITGSITNVGLELSEWTKAHPGAYSLPLSAKNVHARFVEPAGAPPWLELSGGQLSHTASGGVFAAQHARFLGVDLGKVGAGFAREASAIALGFGEADLARAPFRVEVSPNLATPTATFTMTPIAAERLAKPLGIALPVAGVLVSSVTALAFPTGPLAGSVTGSTSITLKGYVPPHPFELDGFIFGNTTTFDSKFAIPAIRDRIVLSEAHLKAGSFELHGDGLLTRAPDHSQATLTLSGQLPCNALAAVEAESRLSKILGSQLAANSRVLALQMVNGSVSVGLKVSADTRNLAAAHLERSIGVGCGLRPLSLAELAKLVPLPPDINQLLQGLPTLPIDLSGLSNLGSLPAGVGSGVAALPSGIPALPNGIPALPTNLPQLPNLRPDPSHRPRQRPRQRRPAKAWPAGAGKSATKPVASSGS